MTLEENYSNPIYHILVSKVDGCLDDKNKDKQDS